MTFADFLGLTSRLLESTIPLILTEVLPMKFKLLALALVLAGSFAACGDSPYDSSYECEGAGTCEEPRYCINEDWDYYWEVDGIKFELPSEVNEYCADQY
jgi:hypothetical protein